MRKTILAGWLLPVLLVVAAGCTHPARGPGVASAGGSATPGATASMSELAQAIRWAQCLREHGVPMPDPVAHGDGIRYGTYPKDSVDVDVVRRAEQACDQYKPAIPAGDLAMKMAVLRQFARCMREHGVENYPDPDATGRFEVPEEVRKDPQYDAAKVLCDEQARSTTPSP